MCCIDQDDSTGDVEGLSEKPEDYSSEDDDRHPISPSKAHTILLPGVFFMLYQGVNACFKKGEAVALPHSKHTLTF